MYPCSQGKDSLTQRKKLLSQKFKRKYSATCEKRFLKDYVKIFLEKSSLFLSDVYDGNIRKDFSVCLLLLWVLPLTIPNGNAHTVPSYFICSLLCFF